MENNVHKPSFKYSRQLGNTLVGAHMGKASITLNKPIIIGASVLVFDQDYQAFQG
ncbi:hypothetical protein RhiirC2_797625 [Rhizophagus irregularis]|uniref:Uncharacterized protein n=1 Tax=Rhizophagus irregularis TaxID=588596 RepID=A0A2N1M7P7_9GLOM|nr:hypothetical protein RhiirC2_797625 [Rhizophagus irregularis]